MSFGITTTCLHSFIRTAHSTWTISLWSVSLIQLSSFGNSLDSGPIAGSISSSQIPELTMMLGLASDMLFTILRTNSCRLFLFSTKARICQFAAELECLLHADDVNYCARICTSHTPFFFERHFNVRTWIQHEYNMDMICMIAKRWHRVDGSLNDAVKSWELCKWHLGHLSNKIYNYMSCITSGTTPLCQFKSSFNFFNQF